MGGPGHDGRSAGVVEVFGDALRKDDETERDDRDGRSPGSPDEGERSTDPHHGAADRADHVAAVAETHELDVVPGGDERQVPEYEHADPGQNEGLRLRMSHRE